MFTHRPLLNNERPDTLRGRAAQTLNALTPWAVAGEEPAVFGGAIGCPAHEMVRG